MGSSEARAIPRFPEPLGHGSRIGVTAPSDRVTPEFEARLDVVLAGLRGQGYVIVEGQTLRDSGSARAPGREDRAAELVDFLLRDDIDAIVPPWGGMSLIELLPLIDFGAIAAARAKWVMGYSDVSTLLLPLTLLAGLATAHGPALMDLVPGQDDPLTGAALAHLRQSPGSSFEQRSSSRWEHSYADYRQEPAATFRLTEPTRWLPLDGQERHVFTGRLLGGCLDTISRLAGTPYGDVPAFLQRHRETGAILFLEVAHLRPPQVLRALWGLRLAGWLDGSTGVLVGRTPAADLPDLGQHEAVRRALGDLGIPVLLDVDCGHRPPQMIFVNGALAEVRFERGTAVVVQTLA